MHDDARRVLVLLGALLLVVLLFFPAPGAYFVADDHPVIFRNTGASLADSLSWFTASRYGWYRPLFDVYIAACKNVYGLNAAGYHAMSILLFALAAALVAMLARLLSRDGRVAVCAGGLFILQSCHSEAVMWIASANELLAGVGALSAMIGYVQFRRVGRLRWLVFATLASALALMAKETAFFLPVIFVVTDILFYRRFTGKPLKVLVFWPVLPSLLLAAMAAAVRVSAVSYSVSYHPLQLAKNLLYYLLLETVAFPVVATDLLAPASGVPVILAAFALALGGGLWLVTWRDGPRAPAIASALLFAVGLALLALVPVIPIVTERTVFLSSAGVALALALLAVTLWDRIAAQGSRLAKAAILTAVLYLAANSVVLLNRNYDWRTAGSMSRSVMAQLAAQVQSLPDAAEVWLIGLPDQVGRAYAFRNAFPDAAALAGYRPAVYAVLDADLEGMSGAQQSELAARLAARPNARSLWYRNRALTADAP